MKIRWNIDTGYVLRIPGWELEIPAEDLEGLSDNEQNDVIDEYVREEMCNHISTYWKRID